MDAVAARFCADVEHWIADTLSLAEKDLVLADYAECKGVYERVEIIGLVEKNLAADRRYAKAVAIVPDPRYDAVEQGLVAISDKGRGTTEKRSPGFTLVPRLSSLPSPLILGDAR